MPDNPVPDQTREITQQTHPTRDNTLVHPSDAIMLGMLTLLSIGVIMVNSALFTVRAADSVTIESILSSRQTAFMLAAIATFFIISRSPIARLLSRPAFQQWIPPATLLAFVTLALVYTPGFADPRNGAHRWVRIPATGLSFQPSELAKWATPLLMAWLALRLSARLRTLTGLLVALAPLAVIAGVIVLEDLGTGFLIAAVGALVLIAAGARFTHFLLFLPFAAAGLAAAIITSPYRLRRLTAFIDPFQDPEGAGYHIIQSLTTIASGGGPGRGLGFGLQKFGYLPEDHTDFLFAVICEELGIVGAAAVLAIYAGILTAAFSITRAARSPFLKLACLGILLTFGAQAVMNLFVVTGLAPTKGIALPLLSAGGTGWIMTAASLGLLAGIGRLNTRENRENHRPILSAPVLR